MNEAFREFNPSPETQVSEIIDQSSKINSDEVVNQSTAIQPLDEMSWTSDELNKWVEAGLVPRELLDRSRFPDLVEHLRANKEKVHACYKRPEDQGRYQLTVPPPSEWSNFPAIVQLDKQTGETSLLEMTSHFDLCEGVQLLIKAKEIKEWETETAGVKSMNKEEQKTFKTALEKIDKTKALTRKEIVAIIEEIETRRNSNKTFRQSRELIDNKLDLKPKEQLTLFDNLIPLDPLQQNSPVIKGLDLDQAEDRIVHTLTLLLSKKSENRDQKSSDYYMGNDTKGLMRVGDIEMETARITVTPHEFYSTYYGADNYGSNHINFLLNKLNQLSKKMFMTTWTIPAKPKKKGSEPRYNKFRTNLPLFQLAILNQDLTKAESQDIDKNKSLIEGGKCLFLFKFQPQFTNNIRERYVEFPEDIHLRIAKAAGKDRYSQSFNLMRDFLFREKQANRYEILRDEETLIEHLNLETYCKNRKKKRALELIDESLEIFSKIDLVLKWEKTLGKLGQNQFKILINPDFK